MITSLKVLSGFAQTLLPQKINFKKGLNILFGPNGSGKTTALKLMAAYSGCSDGGWTQIPLPSFSQKSPKINWHRVFCEKAPGKCECKVSWDGTPSYMWIPEHNPAAMSSFEMTDGILSSQETLSEFIHKNSSGEKILFRLKKLGDALKSPPPSFTQIPEFIPTTEGTRSFKSCNPVYQNNATQFTKYINSFKNKTNTPTLLLDEPDRSISLPDACILWEKVLPTLATKHQLIVATHSPFAFLNKNAHWIRVGKDSEYLEKCKKAISSLSGI